MYKSLENLNVVVYEDDYELADCKVRHDVLKCADEVLKKMEDSYDLQEAYLESVGINPRGSFADIIDCDIFEFLMLVKLKKLYPKECYRVKLSSIEYGNEGEDKVMLDLRRI